MQFRMMAAAISAAAAMLLPSAFAQAAEAPSAGFYNNYSFDSLFPVTNINILTEYGTSTSDTYSFEAAPGANTITNPFLQTSPTLRTFLLGVATDLPGDPEGQQHLVIFTNTAFAARAQEIAFGTLFPNTDEDQLIAYLQGQYTPPNDDSLTFDFDSGDSRSGPNGDLGFRPGQAFSEIAFSNGQIIGSGVSYQSATPGGAPISAAPEPSLWALMIVGVGGLGLALRRRSRRSNFAAGMLAGA